MADVKSSTRTTGRAAAKDDAPQTEVFLSDNEKTLAEADELRAQGKLPAPEPIYIPNPLLHPDADLSGQDQDTEERLEPVPDAILNPQKYLTDEEANDPAPEQSGDNDPDKDLKQRVSSESSSSPQARAKS